LTPAEEFAARSAAPLLSFGRSSGHATKQRRGAAAAARATTARVAVGREEAGIAASAPRARFGLSGSTERRRATKPELGLGTEGGGGQSCFTASSGVVGAEGERGAPASLLTSASASLSQEGVPGEPLPQAAFPAGVSTGGVSPGVHAPGVPSATAMSTAVVHAEEHEEDVSKVVSNEQSSDGLTSSDGFGRAAPPWPPLPERLRREASARGGSGSGGDRPLCLCDRRRLGEERGTGAPNA